MCSFNSNVNALQLDHNKLQMAVTQYDFIQNKMQKSLFNKQLILTNRPTPA